VEEESAMPRSFGQWLKVGLAVGLPLIITLVIAVVVLLVRGV
jgi:hypothetical protein